MNALIDGLKALRLHGMAGCAHDLLASRTPPNLTTALKQLIEAETVAYSGISAHLFRQHPPICTGVSAQL